MAARLNFGPSVGVGQQNDSKNTKCQNFYIRIHPMGEHIYSLSIEEKKCFTSFKYLKIDLKPKDSNTTKKLSKK